MFFVVFAVLLPGGKKVFADTRTTFGYDFFVLYFGDRVKQLPVSNDICLWSWLFFFFVLVKISPGTQVQSSAVHASTQADEGRKD